MSSPDNANLVDLDNRRKNLTNDERRAAFRILQGSLKNHKLPNGAFTRTAKLFSVAPSTISRLWSQGINGDSDKENNVDSRMKGNVGRKKVYGNVGEMIKKIPLHQRKRIRSISAALHIPQTTVFRRLKAKEIKAHSSSVKPFLTEENKNSRVHFIMTHIDRSSGLFNPMLNVIHIDEKWFNLTEAAGRFYLAPGEEDPYRPVKSKHFITKVMFLAAVARPQWDSSRNRMFDGKIGIWPIVKKEPAMRASKNRPRGTMVTKPLNVDKSVYRNLLMEKVIPSVLEKWPVDNSHQTIILQHDNAKPHISPTDPELCDFIQSTNWDIKICPQPPNSPDLNILDLGFFRAIASVQHQKNAHNIDDLINAVEDSFESMELEKLNDCFLTLQACMIETLKCRGSNRYRVPHLGKSRLRSAGNLPFTLTCPEELLQSTTISE